MSRTFQNNPKASRRFVLLKIASGIANGIIDFVSMPLKMLSIAILRVGGLLIEMTGGKASDNESLNAVVIRGILVALFLYSASQYSAMAAAIALTIPWLPSWGGIIIGLLLNLVTQILQARALRRDSLSEKERAFKSVAKQRIDEDQIEHYVDIAQAKAKQFNRSEMLKFRVMGLFACGAWLAEFWVMGSNPVIPWASPWFNFANIPCLVLTVVLAFAFEVFAQMDEEL